MARRRHTAVRPIAAVLGVLVAALIVTSSAAAAPQPFGHSCTAQNGVRFCPTANTSQRIPTFDGVPLDADVTLPAKAMDRFPTIVMMHGYGGSKTNFESRASPAGHYNNNFYAQQGYAVLTYSARGCGNSCGGGPSGDHSGPCGQGYIRLADTRYEARDTQYLLGLLADQGITKPKSIGVTGISYGGGQSMELAFLRDKIRKTDGTLAPWRSPMGKAMEITRRLSALALVGPGRRAASQRPLPRHPGRALQAEPQPGRGADPELHRRPLRAGPDLRLLLRRRPGLEPVHQQRGRTSPDFGYIAGGPAALARRRRLR